jgi:hypothetical protein
VEARRQDGTDWCRGIGYPENYSPGVRPPAKNPVLDTSDAAITASGSGRSSAPSVTRLLVNDPCRAAGLPTSALSISALLLSSQAAPDPQHCGLELALGLFNMRSHREPWRWHRAAVGSSVGLSAPCLELMVKVARPGDATIGRRRSRLRRLHRHRMTTCRRCRPVAQRVGNAVRRRVRAGSPNAAGMTKSVTPVPATCPRRAARPDIFLA